MIRNKEMVFRMSLKERIRLITSAKFGESCAVENYEFPRIRLSQNPLAEAEGKFATLFPSDKALANTWNLPLVRNLYRRIGNEAKAVTDYRTFQLCNSRAFENVSEDYYFTGKFLAEKAKGLNASGAFVHFTDSPAAENELVLRECAKLITDAVMTEASPDAVCLSDTESFDGFPPLYHYEGLLFGVAFRKEEAAQYLFRGCTLVFLHEDFTEELEDYLTDLTEEYKKAKRAYENGEIPLVEFDRRMRAGEILDEELINAACDRMVSLLLSLRDKNAASVDEKKASLDHTREPLFNEALHDRLALRAAQQSVVLLKNHGRVLPLGGKKRVAVLGEYASNPDYQRAQSAAQPTSLQLPFEAINDYEIDCVGYAHGYLAGESGRTDLIETACKLAAEADCALVYLCAEAGAKALPFGQTELVSALAERGVPVIAVIAADGAIDCSFVDGCAAALFTCRGGQGVTRAVLDILTGAVSPSGKLAETFPLEFHPMQGGRGVRYPFGYGLSYTSFEYYNLKITEHGVSCTVTNTGNYDGFATVQMYVQKEGSKSTLGYSLLRGFEKVFVKKNDAVKVEIPFDGNTFRTYDFEKKCYRIEAGDYKIYLADDAVSVKLNGELTLDGHVYQTDVFEGEKIEEDAPVGFTETEDERKIRKAKKKLSFGLKLFLALVLALYYDAVGALLLFGNVVGSKDLIFYIVLGALLAIGNGIAVAYIVVIAKRRKLQKFLHPNDVLSDMIEDVGSFEEIAHVVYREPVPEPDISFLGEEETEETPELAPAESEESRVKKYENAFASVETQAVSREQVSLVDLCANFRDYAKERGVIVELSSVRALFASVAAGKLVFLSVKNREILPEFLAVLRGYFGIPETPAASDEWRSPDDLLWQRGASDTEYLPSDFAHAVNAASAAQDKFCLLLLENVKFHNLRSYFIDFIDYALRPFEDHTLVLSEDLVLRMPENICYLLVPSEAEFEDEVPPELAHAALVAEIVASKGEPGESQEVTPKSVSRPVLEDLIREAREQFYLSEKSWNKLDDFAEAVCANEAFRIDNKSVLTLEKYTSVLLDCGGEESEALVSAFTAKIVPLLRTLKLYREENGGKTLFGLVEKIFGEEDVGAIQRSLVKNP